MYSTPGTFVINLKKKMHVLGKTFTNTITIYLSLLVATSTLSFCHVIVASGMELTWQENRMMERLASELTVTLIGDSSKSWMTEINTKKV